MLVCILTLGCKVNQYESNQIAAKYAGEGHTVVQKFVPDADLYIVNTCAVTAHAEKKSRNFVSRVSKTGKPVTVCGCAGDRSLNKEAATFALQPRKRAFIKVQDGCNNFCTYCAVPYLRGRSTSRPIDDVVAEVAASHKPTVLTGIDLSSYGIDLGTNLGELCAAVDRVGVDFELSSIEVGILTDEFLKVLRGCRHFLPLFHIPLQSGSDAVLKHMNRKYTSGEYLAAVERVKKYFSNAVFSTDVITGYPAEGPADLAATHDLIARVGFKHVHMFPYSDRTCIQRGT